MHFAHVRLPFWRTGRFADALATADAHQARNPFMHVVRIAALAEVGRLAEARHQAQILREASPFFQVEQVGTRFRNPAHADRFQQALRTAGL